MHSFIFLKPDLSVHETTHFSGGQHAFLCAARSLAAAGHTVHLLYCAPKAQLMFSLLQQGSALASLSYSTATEGVAIYQQQQGTTGSITHHVSLSDAEASTAQQLSTDMAGLFGSSAQAVPALSTPYQRLLDECSALVRTCNTNTQQHQQHQQRCWVVLDADGSQEPLPASNNSSISLLEACSAALSSQHQHHHQLLLLVQNIHFLPLGPQGTAPRSPALLAAWGRLGGVLCVSSFVARYVAQHAVPLGLPPQRIYCVHFAAFGVFGTGPFHDYGTAAAQHLPWPAPAEAQAAASSSSASSSSHASTASTPTIGCLKLTPEKGSAIFLALAHALPQLQFLAVCGDPSMQAAAAAGQFPPNLQLVPPGDVDSLLQHMTVLLAPSVWQEAYGMVVTEAVLRGVPVIVSDQGGQSEAALGCPAAVVPMRPMELPYHPQEGAAAAGAAGGAVAGAPAGPSAGSAGYSRPYRWQDRVYPADQDLGGWVQALQRLLGDRGVYERCSAAGREAGLRLVQHQRQLLDQLVVWLGQLAG